LLNEIYLLLDGWWLASEDSVTVRSLNTEVRRDGQTRAVSYRIALSA